LYYIADLAIQIGIQDFAWLG